MSKKQTINERVKALKSQEENIKQQLTSDSDEIKNKAQRTIKIALLAGTVSIVGYWIFNLIFAEEEENETVEPKKATKPSKLSRLALLAAPYIKKVIDDKLS